MRLSKPPRASKGAGESFGNSARRIGALSKWIERRAKLARSLTKLIGASAPNATSFLSTSRAHSGRPKPCAQGEFATNGRAADRHSGEQLGELLFLLKTGNIFALEAAR